MFKIHNLSRTIFSLNSPNHLQQFSNEQNNVSIIPQNGYNDYHRYITKLNNKDRKRKAKQQNLYDPGVFQLYEKTLLEKKQEFLRIRLSQEYESLIDLRNQLDKKSEVTATGQTSKVDIFASTNSIDDQKMKKQNVQKEGIIYINNNLSPVMTDRVDTENLKQQFGDKRLKFTSVHKSNDFKNKEIKSMTRELNDRRQTQKLQNEKSIQCDSTIKSKINLTRNEDNECILLQD